MGHSNFRTCHKCGKITYFSSSFGGDQKFCDDCEKEKKKEYVDFHIACLEKLPTSKRLEIIERWI